MCNLQMQIIFLSDKAVLDAATVDMNIDESW